MRTPTVLIVEDAPSVRQLLRVVLARAGYNVVEAASGASAIRLACRHNPEVIVLDIELPIMNGFRVCERLKASCSQGGARIVMLTARSTDEDRDLALGMGANAFITKPFSPASLINVVADLIADPLVTTLPMNDGTSSAEASISA